MKNSNQLYSNKQKGNYNKDLDGFRTLDYYLELTKDFKSSFSDFVIKKINSFNIIDESESCPVGYKARAGEFLIQQAVSSGVKEIVYVQPRRGFAGISLSWLCKKYDLNLTLLMPSSKLVSDHQALCIELGAKPLFLRVAAMPNANVMAKRYAEKDKARMYIPLGLNHEDVVADGVNLIHNFFKNKDKPKNMWSVISTGVLTRTLQIALPESNFKAVAVARNIQHGELGKAEFYSYHKPFNSLSDLVPTDFNSEPSYDSKCWDYINEYGKEGDWFFNVAGEAPKHNLDKTKINSYRDWNDLRDFE